MTKPRRGQSMVPPGEEPQHLIDRLQEAQYDCEDKALADLLREALAFVRMHFACKTAPAICPRGGLCVREGEWGHPCDRDEEGDRTAACEKPAHPERASITLSDGSVRDIRLAPDGNGGWSNAEDIAGVGVRSITFRGMTLPVNKYIGIGDTLTLPPGSFQIRETRS